MSTAITRKTATGVPPVPAKLTPAQVRNRMLRKISRVLSVERAKRRHMSKDELARHDRARDAPLMEAYNRGDTVGTRVYLIELAMRLQDGEKLSPEVRIWLGNAMIETALNHKRAGAAFGLVPPAVRPAKPRQVVEQALGLVALQISKGSKIREAVARASQQTGLSKSLITKAERARRQRIAS